jgi:hypothetical protein
LTDAVGAKREDFNKGQSKDTYSIYGYLPENFTLNISANWSPPFSAGFNLPKKDNGNEISKPANQGRVQGIVQRAVSAVADAGISNLEGLLKISGLNVQWKYATRLAYSDPPYLQIQIPFVFVAEKNAYLDVTLPIQKLLKLATPTKTLGFLFPPGPTVIGSGENISLQIGNVMYLDSVVLNDVSSQYNTRFDKYGNCIYAQVDVSITTIYAISREDLDEMFIDTSLSYPGSIADQQKRREAN